MGVDLDFAISVLYLKNNVFCNKKIILESAIPYPNSNRSWSYEFRNKYNYVMQNSDIITTVSNYYFSGCMQKRNEYMVNKSDLILAVWNEIEKGGTWNTIKYARYKNKIIRYILLNNI